MSERLGAIASVFGSASILSFGGANTILPQLQLATVDEHHWVTNAQFADCFAIGQVTPGPSTMLVTLLGYQAAGLAGAIVATLAMAAPSCVLAWLVTRLWLRTGQARWHVALEHGLAPVGVGLVAAAGFIVARVVDHGVMGWGVTIAALALLAATRINPLLVIAGGGLAGLIFGGV